MKFLKYSLLVSLLLWVSASFAQNCKNQNTTLDMQQCADIELKKANSQLNGVYNEYKAILDATAQTQLKEVQLAWIKFRDLDCKFFSPQDGSFAPVARVMCLTGRTIQRTKELQQRTKCVEGDMSCRQ
ncbi:MAG: lysozyme inhibitor LprI family protein [Cytophagales bacterium]|nr:lysozyme inhibitor LprI family protein [Cytophagales bacterium]